MQTRTLYIMHYIPGSYFVFGGWNGKVRLDSIERLDPRESRWQVLEDAALNSRKCGFSLVILDHEAFIMGKKNSLQYYFFNNVYFLL